MEQCSLCGRSRLEEEKDPFRDVAVQILCRDADELHYTCVCVIHDSRFRSVYQISHLLKRSCCMHALARTLVEVKADCYDDDAAAYRCIVDEAKRKAIDEVMSKTCETCEFQGTPIGKCNEMCCPAELGNKRCIRALAGLCKDLGHPGLLPFRSQYAKLKAIAACTKPLDMVDHPFIHGPI